MKKTKFSNIPDHGVIQWLTISPSTTVKFGLDHVKLLKSAETWSWVLKSPAMNCPSPKGKDRLATHKEIIPGYRKRLKMENYWIELLSSLDKLLWLTFSSKKYLELYCSSWILRIVCEPKRKMPHLIQRKPWNRNYM